MAKAAPDFILVVIHPFGDYQRGDRITDPLKIEEILSGENAANCNKTPQ